MFKEGGTGQGGWTLDRLKQAYGEEHQGQESRRKKLPQRKAKPPQMTIEELKMHNACRAFWMHNAIHKRFQTSLSSRHLSTNLL